MNIDDFKIIIYNGFAMLLSFSDIENTLQILLLAITIIYTILKIKDLLYKKKDNETS